MTRQELIDLVQRVMDVQVGSEEEHTALVELLQTNITDPHVTNYVFSPRYDEMTAEQVVDKALAYQPIALWNHERS
ncbi:e9imm peptide [Embleya sp. NBC_00896]|uniref:e9imm peptide n=1 Tax=Embleya sp. NBC_00896 TaxID=2975961 RepID=UPI002F90F9C1|nr:bacteriocin immunity protein [Embleya sp. NBC_00896]